MPDVSIQHGKLDEDYWQNCPVAATCSFRELQTGRKPIYGTSVKSGCGRCPGKPQ